MDRLAIENVLVLHNEVPQFVPTQVLQETAQQSQHIETEQYIAKSPQNKSIR